MKYVVQVTYPFGEYVHAGNPMSTNDPQPRALVEPGRVRVDGKDTWLVLKPDLLSIWVINLYGVASQYQVKKGTDKLVVDYAHVGLGWSYCSEFKIKKAWVDDSMAPAYKILKIETTGPNISLWGDQAFWDVFVLDELPLQA